MKPSVYPKHMVWTYDAAGRPRLWPLHRAFRQYGHDVHNCLRTVARPE